MMSMIRSVEGSFGGHAAFDIDAYRRQGDSYATKRSSNSGKICTRQHSLSLQQYSSVSNLQPHFP